MPRQATTPHTARCAGSSGPASSRSSSQSSRRRRAAVAPSAPAPASASAPTPIRPACSTSEVEPPPVATPPDGVWLAPPPDRPRSRSRDAAGRTGAPGAAGPGLRARLAAGPGLARRTGTGLARGARLTRGVARLTLAGHRRRRSLRLRLRAAREDAESDGARHRRRREPTCPVARDHAFSPIVVCTPAPSGRGAVPGTVPGRPTGDTRSVEGIATNGLLPGGERPS